MAARQLAGRRPLYLFTEVCFYPLTFFRRLISEFSGPIVTKLCHMFGGDCTVVYKIQSEIWGSLSPCPQKFGGPKTSKFRTSRFDREYLQMEQDIVIGKTALETAITSVSAYEI